MLIHLINMLRHRRVDWAAMEFLLVSQRKHRTWIIFKQLLLLLLRILAVAAVVLMVAQPVLRSQWGNLLGHHQDPSRRAAGRQLLDVGPLGRHQRLCAGQGGRRADRRRRPPGETQPQNVTLLRFSRVSRPGRGTQPDMVNQPVGAEFTCEAARES